MKRLLALLLVFALLAAPAFASENHPASTWNLMLNGEALELTDDQMLLVRGRNMIQLRVLLVDILGFTDQEADGFWNQEELSVTLPSEDDNLDETFVKLFMGSPTALLLDEEGEVIRERAIDPDDDAVVPFLYTVGGESVPYVPLRFVLWYVFDYIITADVPAWTVHAVSYEYIVEFYNRVMAVAAELEATFTFADYDDDFLEFLETLGIDADTLYDWHLYCASEVDVISWYTVIDGIIRYTFACSDSWVQEINEWILETDPDAVFLIVSYSTTTVADADTGMILEWIETLVIGVEVDGEIISIVSEMPVEPVYQEAEAP